MSTGYYGYSPVDWNRAKDEMRRILIQEAKLAGMIAYSDLVGRVTTISLDADSHALAAMLGDISREEEARGRGMLTVIVTHKHGDQRPGQGFFDLAEQLGRDISDPDSCWIEELTRVHAYWANS